MDQAVQSSSTIKIKQYHEERSHDALGDLTPVEYLVTHSKPKALPKPKTLPYAWS